MGFPSILSFVGFTLLVALIASFATRKTDEKSADGYYLGGRSLEAITIVGSLVFTNLSVEQIVCLNRQSFARGILVAAWEIIRGCALVITATYLLPKYMRSSITNIQELEIIKAQAYPYFLHAIGILLVINVGFMVLIVEIYPNKNEYIRKITDQIKITSWKHAKVVGFTILLFVLSTYFIF